MADVIHVIIRYADREVETISAHEGVIEKHGAVWLGKLGKPLAHNRITGMNKQIEEGIPTYVYLVQKVGMRYEAHRCTVENISREMPKEKNMIPKYYEQQNILPFVTLWTKITKIVKVDKNGLSRLKLANTGTALPAALASSMAGFFIVKDGTGFTPRPDANMSL